MARGGKAEAVRRLHVMSSSHEKARDDLWGEPMDVEEAVGRLHVMNSSHELHVMNSSHEKAPEDLWGEPMDVEEAVGRLHVMNSSHEKAPEDWWGEPMDVVKGRVGLPVTLPLPWVGGSCDGGDEGEATLQSLPRWVMA